MLIFKKEKRVVKLCTGHADKMLECAEAAAAAIRLWVKGEREEAERYNETVSRLEREADTLRREIGDALFDGAYLPQIREDLFRLIQRVDQVANKCEGVWQFFATQNPIIPPEHGQAFADIVDTTVHIVTALHSALRKYFKPKGKMQDVRDKLEEVYRGESNVDKMEWDLTHSMFKSELDLAHKMHLERALAMICWISDCSEDVADEIDIISMKSIV